MEAGGRCGKPARVFRGPGAASLAVCGAVSVHAHAEANSRTSATKVHHVTDTTVLPARGGRGLGGRRVQDAHSTGQKVTGSLGLAVAFLIHTFKAVPSMILTPSSAGIYWSRSVLARCLGAKVISQWRAASLVCLAAATHTALEVCGSSPQGHVCPRCPRRRRTPTPRCRRIGKSLTATHREALLSISVSSIGSNHLVRAMPVTTT
jgi:hypothetical protein